MFHWIEDKEFLKNMRCLCSGIINETVQEINKENIMRVEMQMIGSGARNLETQNASEPIDLDYNLNILELFKWDIKRNAKQIKEYIKAKFNVILKKYNWGNCEDSTSALTTKKQQFKNGNRTKFCIDLAIVFEYRSDAWYRLIHEKTGNINKDRWYWVQGRNSNGLSDKVNWLKKNGLWLEVRETYLKKKNLYLTRNDIFHPSFVCYIETVNEVYSAIRR